jgi:hypothetical protein
MSSDAPPAVGPTKSVVGITRLADQLTAVAAVCSLVVSVYLVGASLIRLREVSTAASAAPPQAPAEGDTLRFLPAAAFEKQPLTLVLVVREECHFCRESEPFYQRLFAELKRHGGVQLTVVSSDPIDTLRQYVRSSSIAADDVFSIALDRSGVSGTPTLALCDSRGRIRRVWVGKLDAAGEREVVTTILSSSATAT